MQCDTSAHPWRSDPNLKGRFHPEFPDDLQALFYDYESIPRRPDREMMWVQLTRQVTAGVYEGTLLNQPNELTGVRQNDQVMIRVAPGMSYPVYLPTRAARDRDGWGALCQKCGFDMLPCPPAGLIDTQFPNRPEDGQGEMQMFTTRCWACGQTMMVWRWATDDEELRNQLPPKPRDVLRSPLYPDAQARRQTPGLKEGQETETIISRSRIARWCNCLGRLRSRFRQGGSPP